MRVYIMGRIMLLRGLLRMKCSWYQGRNEFPSVHIGDLDGSGGRSQKHPVDC